MSILKKYVIIVAGGSGSRMGIDTPKQFLELAGMPVLMHTLTIFHKAYQDMGIILVLPEAQIKNWKQLCLKYHFNIPYEVRAGGETRFHSVKNGLELVEGDGLVGIHDGVRPLVSEDTIRRCYQEAAIYGNAIPVTDMVESVRMKDGDGSKAIDRSELKLVQTPQVFHVQSIKDAFNQEFDPAFTDDASVLESAGGIIHLTTGNQENIKITHPLDLAIGECLLLRLQEQRKKEEQD